MNQTTREKWTARALYGLAFLLVAVVALLVGYGVERLAGLGGATPATAGWLGGSVAMFTVLTVNIRAKVRWR